MKHNLINTYRLFKVKVKGEKPIILQVPSCINFSLNIENYKDKKFLKVILNGEIIILAEFDTVEYTILDPTIRRYDEN